MNDSCKSENKPKGFKQIISSWYFWKPAIAVISGGLLGFLYYFFLGCKGGCAITGSPFGSIFFGAVIGYFIVGSPCLNNKCS